jgi:hypothetical protein
MTMRRKRDGTRGMGLGEKREVERKDEAKE